MCAQCRLYYTEHLTRENIEPGKTRGPDLHQRLKAKPMVRVTDRGHPQRYIRTGDEAGTRSRSGPCSKTQGVVQRTRASASCEGSPVMRTTQMRPNNLNVPFLKNTYTSPRKCAQNKPWGQSKPDPSAGKGNQSLSDTDLFLIRVKIGLP